MTIKITPREAKRMPEPKAHAQWQKENTIKIAARLQKSTDADIIQYLDGKAAATEIKRGLRLLIEQENKAE